MHVEINKRVIFYQEKTSIHRNIYIHRIIHFWISLHLSINTNSCYVWILKTQKSLPRIPAWKMLQKEREKQSLSCPNGFALPGCRYSGECFNQDSDDEPGEGCGTDVRLKNFRIGLVYHSVAAPPASEEWGVVWDGLTPLINIYLVMLFNGLCLEYVLPKHEKLTGEK